MESIAQRDVGATRSGEIPHASNGISSIHWLDLDNQSKILVSTVIIELMEMFTIPATDIGKTD